MSDVDPELIAAFSEEFSTQCQDLEAAAEATIDGQANGDTVRNTFRVFHTIKGNALSIGLQHLGALVHQAEEVLRAWQDGGHPPSPLLGDVILQVLDEMRRLHADPEVVAAEALLTWLQGLDPAADAAAAPAAPAPTPESPDSSPSQERIEVAVGIEDLDTVFQASETLRAQLMAQDHTSLAEQAAVVARDILSLRRRSLRTLIPRIKRLVRETARELGREVDFTITGEQLSADAAIVQDLGAVLPHLLRNGLDHGIEAPDDRADAGKDRCARFDLSFRFEGGSFVVRISEDGRGMDDQAIAQAAIGKGLLTAEQADDRTRYERLMLIFAPGFSTAASVSTVSGRGVGMDAVKGMVEEHGGRIDVETAIGTGSTFELVFPVPYRYDDYLLVRIDRRMVGVPVTMISSIACPGDAGPVEEGMAAPYGEQMPVIGFQDWDPRFGSAAERPLLILDVGGIHAALAVDQLVEFRSALVQGLPGEHASAPFLAGVGRIGNVAFWALDDGKIRRDWNAFMVPA